MSQQTLSTIVPKLALLAAIALSNPGCTAKTEDTEAPPPAPPAQALATPLFLDAALNGDANTVQTALLGGTDVNGTDDMKRTALMLASFNGHLPVVKILVDAGAEVDARDSMGRSPLMFASTGPNSETVALLLQHGAEVNATDGDEHWSPLMFAAAEGHAAVVKTLLQHDANPNLEDIDGETALDFALQREQEQAANLLRAVAKPGEAIP